MQLLDSRQDERERVLRDTDALLLELVLQVPPSTAARCLPPLICAVVQAMVTQEFSSRSVLFCPRKRSALTVATDAAAAAAAAASAAAARPSSRRNDKSSNFRSFAAAAHADVAGARLHNAPAAAKPVHGPPARVPLAASNSAAERPGKSSSGAAPRT